MMEDIEMSFKDLILKMLLKWRTFLISMVIMGVVMGIVGGIVSSDDESQAQESVGAITLDSLKEPLSESTQKNIELAAENYLILQEMLKQKELHLNHSIKMKIDYKNVSTMAVTYRVESKNQAVYPIMSVNDVTSDIIDLYSKEVLSNVTYDRIISETGWDIDTECIKELLITEKGAKELFTIRVMACNEEDCVKMISVVKNRIAESTKDISENYGQYDITLVDELYSEEVNSDILWGKQNRNNEIIALRSEMETLDDNFNAENLAYYEALINNGVNRVQENEGETETSSNVLDVNLKYVLLGFVIGAVLVFIYVLFMYMCSTRLHTSDELPQLTNATVLGHIWIDGKKKRFMYFVDEYIYRVFGYSKTNEEDQIEFVCSNIRVAMKKRNYQKICLVASCDDDDIREVMEQLNNKTYDALTEVYIGVDVLRNAQMLQKMLMADCVVVIEKESVSKYMDIKKVTKMCELHQVDILGNVVLKELS